MLQLAFYLLVSFLASVAGAICGIGGGVIIKPVLDVCGLASVSTISFLSGLTVLSMSLYSVGRTMASGGSQIDKKTGTPLAIGAAAGGIAGKQLFSVVKGLFADPNTVGAVQAGMLSVSYNCSKEIIRFPAPLCRELLDYAKRRGIVNGPVFLTRNGRPIDRTNVTVSIRRLCRAAQLPEEKGSPRCLRKLYQATREGIERNIALLVEQAQDRMMEEEQLSVGWEK